MSANTDIPWAKHSFNPWWGCQHVSPACDHCYAQGFAHRMGFDVFGPGKPRRTFGEEHWREPLAWAKKAKAGVRASVFCMSMGDVLEDRPELEAIRQEQLWPLVRLTASVLAWLFLTKRPENAKLIPRDVAMVSSWGVTAENQALADERLPLLLNIPAGMHFVSVEPMLEPVDLTRWLEVWGASEPGGKTQCTSLDWVIVGAESGAKRRAMKWPWASALVEQCRVASGVPCFVKQLQLGGKLSKNPSEWPEDLRVQEFPRCPTQSE